MDDKPLINRLLSGIVIFKLKDEYIQVKPAKVEDKAFADFYAQEIYEDGLIEGLLTEKDIEALMFEKGWWSKDQDDLVETLTKNLDQMKLDYYNNFFKEDTKQYIKRAIDSQKDKISDLFQKKYIFYDKSCEYLREYSKGCFLIERTAFTTGS